MVYKVRVTLPRLKGFFRVYLVNGAHTLYTFHKQLRSDLEFPVDQPILFKALDSKGAVVARYALIDLGFGPVHAVTLSAAIKAGTASFVYFYDVVSKKNVIVTIEGEAAEKVSGPTLIESKGPIPLEFENGYVAFEDLPDEKRRLPGEKSLLGALGLDDDDDDDDDDDEDFDDDDDDEEDGDKEEEELIYDANE